MDEQRRRFLLSSSGVGKSVLADEDAGQRAAQPISPERRKLLQATHWGRAALRAHDEQARRDPATGRFR